MTTYNQIKAEAERLTARLNFTTDPTNRRILETAIGDLVKMLGKYPAGLVWMAEQRPDWDQETPDDYGR